MRIGIDARFFGSQSKGLGRYTQELVEHLLEQDQQNEYVLFMRSDVQKTWKNSNPRVRIVTADFPWYSFAEQVQLPQVLNKENCDLYHFPHFNVPVFFNKPFIVTIHDLILSHFPTIRATTLGPFLYRFKHAMYKFVIHRALKRSRHIITISEFTRTDLLSTYHIPKMKITVAYEGVGESLAPHDDDERFRMTGVGNEFLLYVGNAYPHKNLESLIDAFADLRTRRPELTLVLVGKIDYFFARLQSYVRERGITGVVFTGYATDDELRWLYHHATVYVFPSMYEGFGLPPLEAMSHSLPVASSNASCMPEILQSAVLYFNPNDLHDMIQVIERLLANPDEREALKEKGRQLVRQYSWKTMAEKTLQVYEKNQQHAK